MRGILKLLSTRFMKSRGGSYEGQHHGNIVRQQAGINGRVAGPEELPGFFQQQFIGVYPVAQAVQQHYGTQQGGYVRPGKQGRTPRPSGG